MKKLIRVISLTLVIITAVAAASVSASAITFECDVKTNSDSVAMINIDTGIEVFAKDADTRRSPAGLTKIMTYIIAVENVKDLDARIEIKEKVMNSLAGYGLYPSGLDWHTGKKLSFTEVLYALMLPRGDDAAMIIADYVSGGKTADFVKLMNEKAEELGCKDTHFVNPTGAYSQDHYTTAHDMIKICRCAMDEPMFSKIVSSPTYLLEGDEYPLINNNSMLRDTEYGYSPATGIKNSENEKAGSCLAASALSSGYAYLCVCLHAPYDEEDEHEYCMEDAIALFDWAFYNLQFMSPATKDTPICEQPINNAWDTKSILLVPESDLNVVLPSDYKESDITIVPDSTDPISAPVSKGDFVTTATVYYKGEPFRQINLVAHDDVGASPILFFTHGVDKVLTSAWFLISVGIVVILFIVFVGVSSSYNKKKRRNKKSES